MVRHFLFRCTFIGWPIIALAISAGCNKTRQQQQAAAPIRPAKSEAAASEVVALAQHYADLLAHRARLPTAASREGATPFTNGTAEVQGYSRTFSDYRIYLDLDSTFLLQNVSIESLPLPEDPKRLVLQAPPLPARLVRLGELRRAFGREQKADGPQEEPYTFNFSYHPRPQLRPVTIQAEIPAFKLTDSTMVERLLVLPAQPL